MSDTVLYCRVGRAAAHPVLSVSPDDANADALIAAKKQHLVGEALKAGGQIPEFEVVAGTAKAKKGE